MSSPGELLVTVIIPTHNRPGLLSRALRSVLEQTYRPTEVVVFDDASQPAVRLPADIAADDRVRLVRSEANLGGARARNEAVALASTPYISFLDDDDEWLPQKLERDVAVMRSVGDRVALVESGYELWDGDRLVYRYVPAPARPIPFALLKESTISPSTVTMRRDAYEEMGGMDPVLPRCHDWDLWLRLIGRYEVASLPEVHTLRTYRRLETAAVIRDRVKLLRRAAPLIQGLGGAEKLRLGAYHAAVLGAAGVRLLVGRRMWYGVKRPLKRLGDALTVASGGDPTLKRW